MAKRTRRKSARTLKRKELSVADRVALMKKRGLGSIRVKTAKTVKELQIGRIYADSRHADLREEPYVEQL